MAGLGNIFSGIQALEGSHPNLPYLYAFVANVSLIGMQMGMRSISLIFSPFFALFIRGFCLLSLNSVVLWSTSVDISQKDPTTFRMLMKRSIFSSLALVSFLGSLPFVPMSIVNSLFNISPIIIYFVEAYNYKVFIELSRNPSTGLTLASLSFVSWASSSSSSLTSCSAPSTSGPSSS